MNKIIPKFKGVVKDGKLTLNSQSKFDLYVGSLSGDIELVIKKAVKTRSLDQNALYWLYLGVISDDTGHTAEEIHEYAKRLYLKPQILTLFGKNIKVPGTTTTLSKNEFSEYLSKIEQLTNIPIPNWNDVDC